MSKTLNRALAIALALSAVLLFAGCGSSGGMERPIQALLSGMQKCDPDVYLSAFSPEAVALIRGDYSPEMMKANYSDLESQYGKNLSFSYEVLRKEALGADDLETMEADYLADYNKKISISQGYVLSLSLTVKGDTGTDTDNDDVTVMKVGRTWYAAGTGL